jgi:hypothetical protein
MVCDEINFDFQDETPRRFQMQLQFWFIPVDVECSAIDSNAVSIQILTSLKLDLTLKGFSAQKIPFS